ncbi:MAG TPA: hypothetical protein VD963_10560 [Phycisphaerales bacterium]|nr:hypothetical protein [Phycisphaerales bacterium]
MRPFPSAIVCARALAGAAALTAPLALGGLASRAEAQASVAGFPTSHLDVSTGWSGWYPFDFPYGAGNPSAGSSGIVNYTYSGPSVASVTVNINELRNSPSPSFPNNVIHSGEIIFTPTDPAVQYTLGGSVGLVMSGSVGSSLATGSLALFEVGGPLLASYTGALARIGASEVGGLIFDAATPILGSQVGVLSGASTYRLIWQFDASTVLAGDTTATVNVDPSFQSNFSIAFAVVPAPGAAALLGVAGLVAARRRRS